MRLAAFHVVGQNSSACSYLVIYCPQTYVTNINAQVDKFPELKDLGLVTLNQSVGTSKVPKEANKAVRCVSDRACVTQPFCGCTYHTWYVYRNAAMSKSAFLRTGTMEVDTGITPFSGRYTLNFACSDISLMHGAMYPLQCTL